MGYKGYWDTHDEERETLKKQLAIVSKTAKTWRDMTRATGETKDSLVHFCRKYKIITPKMQHGGNNRKVKNGLSNSD